jgi:Xaa-Pro aminopeptidase
MEFTSRLKAVQVKMDSKDIDLVVLGSSPNFQYLTGSSLNWRRFRDLSSPADSVFIPREGDPVILMGTSYTKKVNDSWIEDVRQLGMFEDFKPAVKAIIEDLVGKVSKVAIGEYTSSIMVLTLANYCKGAKFSSAKGLMEDIRSVKSQNEIEKLQKVAKLTDDVMDRIISQLDEGDTMRETNLKIETMGRMVQASDVSFPCTSGFYKADSLSNEEIFNYDSDQGLEEGTSIAFDVGFVLDGYCSDWGRSFYFGKPREHIATAYSTLMTAVVETIDAIGEEINKVNEIFPFIEMVCDREGYGDYLRKRHPFGIIGHQIGVEVHESPWLKQDNEHELVDGMVFCIEPKLWNNGEYYLRVEDMVLIENGKAKSLTSFDRDRFEL